LLTIRNLPRIPNWVRTDVLMIIEKEAMKQFFSAHLIRSGTELLKDTPKIREAVETGAKREVNELLQRLVTEILSSNSIYSGSAGKFVENAIERGKEARRI